MFVTFQKYVIMQYFEMINSYFTDNHRLCNNYKLSKNDKVITKMLKSAGI